MRLFMVLAIGLAGLTYGCSDDGGKQELAGAIPTFTGAEPEPGSVSSEPDALSGAWRTSDDVGVVRDYFARELRNSDWDVSEIRHIDDGVVIQVEDSADPNREGTIIIRREGDSTRIVETIGRSDDGEDAGSGNGDPGGASLGALPEGYPADVPLPDDAQIVSGSSPSVDGEQYYLVDFTSASSPEEMIWFFTAGLGQQGWEFGERTFDREGFAITFNRGNDRVTVTGGGDDDGTTAAITIIIAS